jgi:DNA-binding response OmpR family regulator
MRTTGPKLAARANADRRKANRTRPCILVAEDYGVIGMMLYEDLSEAGFEVSGPFTSCSAALASLDTQTPDAAILDIDLNDGPCVALAQKLREKRVPFLVLTGHHSDASSDDVFSGAPWLAKPMSYDSVINTVRTLLEGSASVLVPTPSKEVRVGAGC